MRRLRTPLSATATATAMGLAWALAAMPVPAQQRTDAAASGAGIYTCVDDKGNRLTSDRPIPACIGKEQRVLNRDGSLRRILPPTLTADERADQEAAERKAAAARAAQADAVRRDRNLITRFPNEAAHRKAREAALDTVRAAIKAGEQRVLDLAAARKPLEEEAEFYKGKTLPLRLKQQIDANDAAVEAQKNAAQNQEAELVRINRLYDAELAHLRLLWAGAQPGSVTPPAPAGTVDLNRGAASAGR